LKKILFISHEASRTGAPLILLHFIKWLNNNIKNIQFDVLLIKNGAIAGDFEKECTNTFIFSEIHKPLRFSEIIAKKIFSKLGIKQKQKEKLFFKNIASNNYNLIYANTVATIAIAVKIKKYCQSSKLLVHIHELNTIIKTVAPDFSNYRKYVDKYIAVSYQVKNNLIDNCNVHENLIDVIYEYGIVNEDAVSKDNKTFTIGASGNAHWRKGDDIFIQVANYINKNYPQAKINFVWVGNNLNNKYIIEDDIEKLGLKQVVSFVGEQTNPINFYKDFDVFLLTSREDPFPLVCIEAANLKKPIICFEKASGTAEVIKKGGGFVVPYLDIEAMGEKIMYYYNNPSKLNEDGLMAQELFANFTPEKICPQLYESMSSLLK
jgi:glycosyltransferase involved in cell wall biosynthesis